MNIIPVVCDLLLRHQKAVIPGFGTFVIVQRPAQLNKVTRELSPPAMSIRFDKNRQTDDGQLTGYLVRRLKMDKDIAVKAVDDLTQQIREQLGTSGTILLEGLGTLTEQKSGDIKFDPDTTLQQKISVFDLPRIMVPEPPVQKTEAIPEAVSKTYSAPEQVYISGRKRRWWIPVSIIVILAALLAGIQLTGNFEALTADVKALFGMDNKEQDNRLVFGNPVETREATGDTLRDQISRELDEQVDRSKVLSYEEPQTTVNTQPEKKITETAPADPPKGFDKQYHIIAGAFLVPGNAEKQKSTLARKGINSEILPKKGNYYMVSLGSFDTQNEASSEMKKLTSKVEFDLWVLRSK